MAAEPTPQELVSTAEIRSFRTSMSARRFPALRDLKDEDIASLVLAERKARNARLYGGKYGLDNLGKSGPLEDFRRAHLTRDHQPREHQTATKGGDGLGAGLAPKKPPFSPVNPTEAKQEIYRKGDAPYNTLNTPYDAERFRYIPDDALLPFVPNSASESKKTVAINYYMNSPDAETLEMERRFIADRAADNTMKLRKKMKWERTYSPNKSRLPPMPTTQAPRAMPEIPPMTAEERAELEAEVMAEEAA